VLGASSKNKQADPAKGSTYRLWSADQNDASRESCFRLLPAQRRKGFPRREVVASGTGSREQAGGVDTGGFVRIFDSFVRHRTTRRLGRGLIARDATQGSSLSVQARNWRMVFGGIYFCTITSFSSNFSAVNPDTIRSTIRAASWPAQWLCGISRESLRTTRRRHVVLPFKRGSSGRHSGCSVLRCVAAYHSP